MLCSMSWEQLQKNYFKLYFDNFQIFRIKIYIQMKIFKIIEFKIKIIILYNKKMK